MMGEARRRRLELKKKQAILKRREGELARKDLEFDRELAKYRTQLLQQRSKYDEVTLPWRKHLGDFADRVGPMIFPKNDKKVAQFILDRMLRMNRVGGTSRQHGEDVSVLAALLNPFVKAKSALLEDGLALLQARVREENDRLEASEWAAIPGESSDLRYILSAIYAERMLEHERPKDVYIPFEDIDWRQITHEEAARVTKIAADAFLQDEASLTGVAAEARDAFNALSEEHKERYRELAREVPKAIRDEVIEILKPKKLVLQIIFDSALETARRLDKRITRESASLYAFALAKMILREMTITDEEMLSKASEMPPSLIRLMESELTGEAKTARIMFGTLTDTEQLEIEKYVECLPAIVNSEIERALNAANHPEERISLQGLFDILLPVLRSTGIIDSITVFTKDHPELESDFAPILAYVIAKKAVTNVWEEEHAARQIDDDSNKSKVVLTFTNRIWDDAQLTTVGVHLWERTYKIGKGDADVTLAARAVAEAWNREHPSDSSTRMQVVEDIIAFSAKWAVHAFQRITTTHTYAAALMCSDADRAVLADLEMQWNAFVVCLPNGLLAYTDDGGVVHEYNRILVGSFDKSASLILLNQHGDWSQPNILVHRGSTIADVLEATGEDFEPGNVDLDMALERKIQRIMTLARRLVAGLLLALQTQANFKSTVHAAKRSKNGRQKEEPEHRVVFVGAPLKIDCRPAIAEYIARGRSNRGKNAAPAFQTLVRGHFRRQVCGTGRRDRKVIWIEPFWRGGEDAPILTRPKRVVI
jgi:hypothetical protein